MRHPHSSLRHHLFSALFVVFLSLNATSLSAEEETPQQTEFKTLAKEVLAVMDTWARSWAQLKPRGYISSYSPDYIGKGFPSHFTWAANRQKRLEGQKRIKLSLTNVSLKSTKVGYFTVTFTQNYQSDTYKDTTNKQLDFKLIDKQWYIVAEKSLP